MPKFIACLIVLMVITGCAPQFQSDFDPPTVTITSFRSVPGQGLAPRFAIGLRIINPNRIPLEISGISYNASIEGHPLLAGASNDLPVIEAYGEGNVTLAASADLLGGIGLIADLMKQPRHSFAYALAVKVDLGGFLPVIRVEKTGDISLDAQQ